MNTTQLRLLLAASATALLSACVAVGAPGFGDASNGCRTVYVFAGGGVQPISNCGGLPRDDSFAPKAMIASVQAETIGPPADPNAPPQPVAQPISGSARAMTPRDKPASYPGANEMIEHGDMAAFMTRVRADYAKKTNSGAWGFVIIDAIAADDPATAQGVIDALAGRQPPEWLSANHLRPWVYAFNGRPVDAQAEMPKLKRVLPAATLLGHRALIAEGLGDVAGALAIYDEAPDDFQAPGPEDAGAPDFFARQMAFNGERLLALRHAELLRAAGRGDEAIALLTKLTNAQPGDTYALDRLNKARAGQDLARARTLKQAFALALADEADLVEQRQTITSMMVARGAKAPFNYLLSSIRQSALLIDPDNGDIRLSEVADLYSQGKFEPALRLAQEGKPARGQLAAMTSIAALAGLQLGSPDTLTALTERSLQLDGSADAKVQAAGNLTSGNRTDRALALIDEALKQGGLSKDQRITALMARGQAQQQAGNIAGAVEAARAANAIDDDETTQQFLASMLVDSPQREDGLAMMRRMMADQPENTSLMNNFGYSLIDGYASQQELDEGFKLLKQAVRLTPDEPNLLDSVGWAYYQYGDFHEASRFIGMALDAYTPFLHWELNNHMGDVQWRLGEQDKAREAWKAALAAYPPSGDQAAIEAKLRNGLTTPAPTRRDTPEVPLNKDSGGTSDI